MTTTPIEKIYIMLDLVELFKMTVVQRVKGEARTLTFFVIADSLAEAVKTMNLNIEETEEAFPDTKMILLKASALDGGLRIAPAIALDIVSQITGKENTL